MFRFIMGVIMVSMALIIGAALMPAVNDLMDPLRDNTNFNCASYAGANPYNSTLDSNTLGCTIVPLTVPLIILSLVLGGVGLILYGKQPDVASTY